MLLSLVAGCGDSVSGPHQPALSSAAKLQIAVSPPAVSGRPGATTDTALISVVAADHFTGAVTVHLEGLPRGATTWPRLPVSIKAGVVQPLAITLPPTAVPDSSKIIIHGSSNGETARSAVLALRVLPLIRTYRDGSLLVLERIAGRDTIRLALDAAWGGGLVEASVNGVNVVNSHDPGREVQAALYDREQLSPLGWNPVQAGDSYGNGSPVSDERLDAALIYTKTRPLHWYPDRLGGSASHPVPSDVYIEQWVEPVPDQPTAFHFRYRITHFGSDEHTTARQEVPAVYTNKDFSTLVYYGGETPWAAGNVSSTSLPSPSEPIRFFRNAERWASLVNKDSVGLTLYAPNAYGYVEAASDPSGSSGPKGWAFNYLRPLMVFGLPPRSTLETDFYLILGDYRAARRTIYEMRKSVQSRNILAPYLTVDQPSVDTILGGNIALLGWSFGNSAIARVSVSVDDGSPQVARYGTPRPDVAGTFPGVPLEIGFAIQLDTRAYANGKHTLRVRAVDAMGMVATRNIVVHIEN